MIKIGERVPDATLTESTQFGEACPVSPEKFSATSALEGKRVVVFGLPGAFTPTCSSKHVPGYVANASALKAKKVDEIWCIAVNDGYVMAAWGRDQKALGAIRFIGDGSAEWTKALGLDTDIPTMGIRTRRFSMFVDDGVVKHVNVEEPGKFESSTAEAMLALLG
jgi:peroxiredoxin